MLATVNTLALTGIEAKPVMVEIDIQNGLPAFDMFGLLAMIDIKDSLTVLNAILKPIR